MLFAFLQFHLMKMREKPVYGF